MLLPPRHRSNVLYIIVCGSGFGPRRDKRVGARTSHFCLGLGDDFGKCSGGNTTLVQYGGKADQGVSLVRC
jgi:hypothetical protein